MLGLSEEAAEKAGQKEMDLRIQVLKLPSVMVQLYVYKTTQLLKWN